MPLAELPSQFPFYLLLPLLSSFLYVAGGLCLRRAADFHVGVWRTTFVWNIATTVVFIPLIWIMTPGGGPTPIWQPFLIAVVFIVGQSAAAISLNRGDVSIATPVIGMKVVFVAIFVTLLAGRALPLPLWISATMSACGIVLLNRRSGGTHRRVGLTIASSLLAAMCYGLFDVLVRSFSPAWGVGRLLPAVFLAATLLSFFLVPMFEGSLFKLPAVAWRPLGLGVGFIAIQSILLLLAIGLFDDVTRINVVYNSRGIWSILAVYFVGHWFASQEQHLAPGIIYWRLAGATLMLAAIVLAIFGKPASSTTPPPLKMPTSQPGNP